MELLGSAVRRKNGFGGAVRGEGELWFLSDVWLREKEMALGSCGEVGWLWFSKDERPKGGEGLLSNGGGSLAL